jgi:hypothetical protein
MVDGKFIFSVLRQNRKFLQILIKIWFGNNQIFSNHFLFLIDQFCDLRLSDGVLGFLSRPPLTAFIAASPRTQFSKTGLPRVIHEFLGAESRAPFGRLGPGRVNLLLIFGFLLRAPLLGGLLADDRLQLLQLLAFLQIRLIQLNRLNPRVQLSSEQPSWFLADAD